MFSFPHLKASELKMSGYDSSDPDSPRSYFLRSNSNSSSNSSNSRQRFCDIEPEVIIREDVINEDEVMANTGDPVYVGPEKRSTNGKQSYVWNYMGFLQESGKTVDRSYVYCKICGAKLKYCKSTSSLISHLKKHPEVGENHINAPSSSKIDNHFPKTQKNTVQKWNKKSVLWNEATDKIVNCNC